MPIPVWLIWVGGAAAAQQVARSGALGPRAQGFAQSVQDAILRGPGTGASVSTVASRAQEIGVTNEDVMAAMRATGKPADQITPYDILDTQDALDGAAENLDVTAVEVLAAMQATGKSAGQITPDDIAATWGYY